jgi:hypothetical protein
MTDCPSGLPLLFCHYQHYQDVFWYLLPSIILAAVIRFLSMRHAAFLLFLLAGTVCHELAHLIAGLLSGARPRSFSIIPRRAGNTWQLGSVMLTNIRWYNAAPAALAPLAIILIPVAVAVWRTHNGLRFGIIDVVLTFTLAPQFLSFWPSGADWKIAARSWPYLILVGVAWWITT